MKFDFTGILVGIVMVLLFSAGELEARICLGDCDGSDDVTVDEIITMVNIGLGSQSVSMCFAGDANTDGEVTVDEIVAAVNNALNGCPEPPTARIEIGSASGEPGDVVVVGAALVGSAGALFTASIDLTYDPSLVRVERVGDDPECTIDPSLGAGTASNKMLLKSVQAIDGDRERLRVGIISFTVIRPLPDGPLFTCRFGIDPGAAPGDVGLAGVADGGGELGGSIQVASVDGSIAIAGVMNPTATPTPQPPSPTPTITTTPTRPRLRIVPVSGISGRAVAVPVALEAGATNVVATSHDILFDPNDLSVVLDESEQPSCAINPAIGAGTAFDKMLLLNVLPAGDGRQILRVGVVSFTNFAAIPDGELFRCEFRIDSAVDIPLEHVASAASLDDPEIPVDAIDGAIRVRFPLPFPF